MSRWRERHIVFVFQFHNLLLVLTSERNEDLPLLLPSLSRSQRKRPVSTTLSMVGLDHRVKHYPPRRSGEQERRVGIALVGRCVLTRDRSSQTESRLEISIAVVEQSVSTQVGVCLHGHPHAADHGRRVCAGDGPVVYFLRFAPPDCRSRPPFAICKPACLTGFTQARRSPDATRWCRAALGCHTRWRNAPPLFCRRRRWPFRIYHRPATHHTDPPRRRGDENR